MSNGREKIERQEVIESPCCRAPSTSLVELRVKAENEGKRRCVRCRKPFYVLVDDFESDDEAAAVHRIRMAKRGRVYE